MRRSSFASVLPRKFPCRAGRESVPTVGRSRCGEVDHGARRRVPLRCSTRAGGLASAIVRECGARVACRLCAGSASLCPCESIGIVCRARSLLRARRCPRARSWRASFASEALARSAFSRWAGRAVAFSGSAACDGLWLPRMFLGVGSLRFGHSCAE